MLSCATSKDADGSRLLQFANSKGDIVIEGRDFGAGVERIFGYREYEWVWTIPAASVGALLHALQATGDVLSAHKDDFLAGRTLPSSLRVP